MQPPESATESSSPSGLPAPARTLAALVVFGALAAGTVFALVGMGGILAKHGEKSNNHDKVANAAAAGFFYEAVGRAPGLNDAAAAAATPPSVRSSYTLELKVTSNRDDAEELIDELHDQGIEAFYTPLSRSGRVVYRVRRGIYPSEREARQALAALRTKPVLPAKVVKLQ